MKQPLLMVYRTLEEQYYKADKSKDLFGDYDLMSHISIHHIEARKALNNGLGADKDVNKVYMCLDFLMDEHEPKHPHYIKTYYTKEQLNADKEYMDRHNYIGVVKLPYKSSEFVVVNWLKRFN